MNKNRVFFSVLLIVVLTGAAFIAFTDEDVVETPVQAVSAESSMPVASDVPQTTEPAASPMGDITEAINNPDTADASQMPAANESPLLAKRWMLTALASGETVAEGSGPYFTLQEQGNRVEGMAGCNRFSGQYVLADDSLSFPDGFMSTKMACDHMSLETAFLNTMAKTRKWIVANMQLNLLDENDGIIARFEEIAPETP